MSTAFMVDSILQDKDEQTHDSFSSGLDTDSDHKDSVCDSPPPNYHHHRHGSGGPDEFLQSYALLRNHQTMNRNSLMDNDMGSNDGSGCGDSDGDVQQSGNGGDGSITELCCAKCGHFQIGNNKTIIDNEIQYEFKCNKCGCGDYLQSKETIITKDNVKPVLKFSVSAILGDRNDFGKVKNGKFISNLITTPLYPF